RGRPPAADVQRNALVVERAVAIGTLKRLAERIRGGEHIIKQADFAQLGVAAEMKPEQIVLQRVGGELQQLDLALRGETGRAVFDLFRGQAGRRKQGRKLYSRRAQARTSLTRHDARGARRRDGSAAA